MPDESLLHDGPDWPDELREPVAKLGKPQAIFRTAQHHVRRRTFTGLGMIVGGALANYLYWFVLAGPAIPEHFLMLLLFGTPLSGLAVLYTAWRDRGLWVLVYPTGILRWQRGSVVSFPWAEIESISFVRVTRCDNLVGRVTKEGNRISAWLPWDQTDSKMLGAYMILTREDGATAILPTALSDFVQLSQIVQEELFRELWPRYCRMMEAGDEIDFGVWSLSRKGLRKKEEWLKWKDFQLATIDSGKVVVRANGKWRPWAETSLHQLPNPHIFLALIEKGPP